MNSNQNQTTLSKKIIINHKVFYSLYVRTHKMLSEKKVRKRIVSKFLNKIFGDPKYSKMSLGLSFRPLCSLNILNAKF